MDCFENNSLLEGVQCSVYGIAQDIYDYAYSFAQGVDSIADSLIPKLPVVEARNEGDKAFDRKFHGVNGGCNGRGCGATVGYTREGNGVNVGAYVGGYANRQGAGFNEFGFRVGWRF